MQITNSYIQNPTISRSELARDFNTTISNIGQIIKRTVQTVWEGASPKLKRQFPFPLLPLSRHIDIHRRERKIRFQNLIEQVKHLRDTTSLTRKQIANQLGVKFSSVDRAINILLASREINQRPSGPRERGALTRLALKKILNRSLVENPNTAVRFTELAKEVGITRERIRQLYPKIAAEQPVPPVISRKTEVEQESFDRQVQNLILQGLNSEEISRELHVTKRLVHQARSRLRVKTLQANRERIQELRRQGYGSKKIALMTGIPVRTADVYLRQLFKKDESLRLRKKYQTREEVKQLREQVAKLRLDPRNLTTKQIAEITGEKESSINWCINKLITEGIILKRK